METIDIALAADAGYFPGLLVTACSIARHASRTVRPRFNILDGGIGAENRAFLREKLSRENPNSVVRYMDVDDSRFSRLPEWRGHSRMAYARLLLPELVADAEAIVYCDVDFLWQDDIAGLWGRRDSRYPLQAVKDSMFDERHRDALWYREHGIGMRAREYVCSGLMIVNLRTVRETLVFGEALRFLADHPDAPYIDQTAINAVVEDIGLLPAEWGLYSTELPRSGLGRAKAIHFGGDTPWKRYWWDQLISPAWGRWHEFNGSFYGMSAEESLRQVYSDREVFIRRTAGFLLGHAWSRALVFLLLKVTNRGGYIGSFKTKKWLYED